MSKRKPARKKRASSPGLPVLLLLILIAAAAGWYLLRPTTHRAVHETPTSEATEAPTESPTQPLAAAGTETPEETATPEATPTASETPSAPPASASVAPRVGNPNAPKLALIIDDCGQWLTTERGFIALPVPVTLSVLPHVHGSATIAQEAKDAGKGVMLHLPMETISGMDPGPGKITTEMTDSEITAQVQDDLAQVPLADGVNNHEGSKASADERVMKDVIRVLAERDDFFIDSRTNSASVGEQIAEANGVKTAARDVFLDNKEDVAYSEAQLREAEAIAKRTGSAIAIGHPRVTTLEAVKALIPEFQADGIQFVLAQDLTR